MSCSSARHKNCFSINEKYYIMVVMPMDKSREKSELQAIQYQEKQEGSQVTCQRWPPPLLELKPTKPLLALGTHTLHQQKGNSNFPYSSSLTARK